MDSGIGVVDVEFAPVRRAIRRFFCDSSAVGEYAASAMISPRRIESRRIEKEPVFPRELSRTRSRYWRRKLTCRWSSIDEYVGIDSEGLE